MIAQKCPLMNLSINVNHYEILRLTPTAKSIGATFVVVEAKSVLLSIRIIVKVLQKRPMAHLILYT